MTHVSRRDITLRDWVDTLFALVLTALALVGWSTTSRAAGPGG